MHSTHFIGIGSNIGPKVHIPLAIDALLEVSSGLALSRVLETEAKGMLSDSTFLNAVVCLCNDLDQRDLKNRLNIIEGVLGRDRSDPDRGRKDRSIDLDVLLSLSSETVEVTDAQIPDETYYRPQMVELVHFLGFACPVRADFHGRAVELRYNRGRIGSQPVQIGCRDTLPPRAVRCQK